MSDIAFPVSKRKVELEGPYECPYCGGHFMADCIYLDQVKTTLICMYCKRLIVIKEAE